MPFLKISEKLSGNIATKSQKIKTYHQNEIDVFIKTDESFQKIFSCSNKLLEKSQFVVIKNIGFNQEKSIFEAFVKLFGVFYGAVEYTGIKVDWPYTACKYDAIELHNDDAIDLHNQPKNGFIQVLNEDPLKITKNGLVKIDDIIHYLETYDEELLFKLFNHNVPMLAYGINYDNANKDEILTQEPIFYKEHEENKVRFDLESIQFYYRKKKITQSIQERKMINDFLSVAKKFRVALYLEAGDILIHHNKRTLHDRTGCSLELNSDGSLNTRDIFVSFTREG
ncbi:MAG: TauD/TfdA family dioxygenase [Mariprofundaceae bacterium]|nr:TauD/TfdA family dioxygenase [Mariprofundaceae bacterium]